MTPTSIENQPNVVLNDVSLRFREYHRHSNGLKEAVMRWVRPPQWVREHPPEKKQFWGVRELNLQLHEGDRLGIVGPNGAGKSTLLKLISRIYRPSSGKLQVTGRLAPLIEIGAGFIPELSGRDNAYLYGAILGLSRKLIRKRMEQMVAFAELEDFVDMPVKYYSTGMHLRWAFTLATEVAPDILILDELYAGGDAGFIKKANRRLDEFVARSRILILVAHDMEYILRFCNRAIGLSGGRIVLQGSPQQAVAWYQGLGNVAPDIEPSKERECVTLNN